MRSIPATGELIHSIQAFGVYLDHVPVRVEDINLRKACCGVRLQLYFPEIHIVAIFAVPLGAQELDCIAVAAHTDGEMDVARVDSFVTPERRGVVHDEMHMLILTNLKPRARK